MSPEDSAAVRCEYCGGPLAQSPFVGGSTFCPKLACQDQRARGKAPIQPGYSSPATLRRSVRRLFVGAEPDDLTTNE